VHARNLRLLVGPFLVLVLSARTWAQVTERESVSSAGVQGDLNSTLPCISADGRYVAFQSDASTLVAGDTNGLTDIFVRDRYAGTLRRVNVTAGGAQANGTSSFPAISADGRFVAFRSAASNLLFGFGTGPTTLEIYVVDLSSGAVSRASEGPFGLAGNHASHTPSISADGRYVAFSSEATNLVANDTNDKHDIFVRDRELGVTVRVSVTSTGGQANGDSFDPSISGNGRRVAFKSNALNLTAEGGNTGYAAFVHDLETGATNCVSLGLNGAPQLGSDPAMSSDGDSVAYFSGSDGLVAGDTNNRDDVFVHDLLTGTTSRIEAASGGGGGISRFRPSISGDGRFVAFDSDAASLPHLRVID